MSCCTLWSADYSRTGEKNQNTKFEHLSQQRPEEKEIGEYLSKLTKCRLQVGLVHGKQSVNGFCRVTDCSERCLNRLPLYIHSDEKTMTIDGWDDICCLCVFWKTVLPKETTLERADFILQLFANVEKLREMLIIFFLSSFCQLMSPWF